MLQYNQVFMQYFINLHNIASVTSCIYMHSTFVYTFFRSNKHMKFLRNYLYYINSFSEEPHCVGGSRNYFRYKQNIIIYFIMILIQQAPKMTILDNHIWAIIAIRTNKLSGIFSLYYQSYFIKLSYLTLIKLIKLFSFRYNRSEL